MSPAVARSEPHVALDTTRLLRTGQADLESAVAALHADRSFRFITKALPARVNPTRLKLARNFAERQGVVEPILVLVRSAAAQQDANQRRRA